MMTIDATGMHFQALCDKIRQSDKTAVTVKGCMGQRYIASGLSGREIKLHGTPGNALGAYLNGSTIEVFGNAQDATGDTMNDGEIIVHGNCGDACGYAMRGGKIFVQGNAGYRAGIHMKEYAEKKPTLVIGGTADHFLGEYLAGGLIVVLGIGSEGKAPVGDFCGTGMHGGKILLRGEYIPNNLPDQVLARPAEQSDLAQLIPLVEEFCAHFGGDAKTLLGSPYLCLVPDSKNPYKQMYVHN